MICRSPSGLSGSGGNQVLDLEDDVSEETRVRKVKYAKLSLVGEVGVGKTSLSHRFVAGIHIEAYKPTLEVCWREHVVATDNYEFKLVLWDTAGEERFHALTAHILRGTSAVLLVFDVAVKETYDRIINFWLPWSENAAPEAMKVMVGNKIDQELPWAVSPKEILELCEKKNMSFYQTSARTGFNVKEFFVEVGTNAIKKMMQDVREDSDLLGSFKVASGDEIWRQPRRVAERQVEKTTECPSCTIL